jgi:hypothetical protein
MDFFKAFSENHIDNDPYKILFSQGDWTCSVANFIKTFNWPLKGFDGKPCNPQSKNFK